MHTLTQSSWGNHCTSWVSGVSAIELKHYADYLETFTIIFDILCCYRLVSLMRKISVIVFAWPRFDPFLSHWHLFFQSNLIVIQCTSTYSNVKKKPCKNDSNRNKTVDTYCLMCFFVSRFLLSTDMKYDQSASTLQRVQSENRWG